MSLEKRIERTIDEIRKKTDHLRIASNIFEQDRVSLERIYVSKNLQAWELPQEYWRLTGVHDALAQSLSFSTRDIQNLEDMELAQKARYFFDLLVWVKYLTDPKKNALSYYEHLLRGKKSHYESVLNHLENEVKRLKGIDYRFQFELYKLVVKNHALNKAEPTDEEFKIFLERFEALIDKDFSIYRKVAPADYGSYANIVNLEVIARYKADQEKLEQDIKKFESRIQRKLEKKHDSFKYANLVGMGDEYGFIFRLTSQHLHATPVSMSTNMGEISTSERLIFLEYIRAKICDVLEHSLYLKHGFQRAQPKIPGLGGFFLSTQKTPKQKSISFSNIQFKRHHKT